VLATIDSAQKQGQLDNTQLTLRDLGIITEAYVSILRGTHHPRVSYPKEESAGQNVNTAPRK
jgi:membrane-associated HD superfamily phosphohydrolase